MHETHIHERPTTALFTYIGPAKGDSVLGTHTLKAQDGPTRTPPTDKGAIPTVLARTFLMPTTGPNVKATREGALLSLPLSIFRPTVVPQVNEDC